MALNKKRIDRSKRSSSGGGGGGFFKLQDGKNIVRVFAFPHTVRKKDFTKGFYRKSDGIKVGEEFDELDREVYRHFTEEGVVNCIGAGCQHCEEADELMNSKTKRDQKAGKQLRASRSFYVNLVDVDNNPDEACICGLPQTVYSEILSYVEDPEFGESILGVDGRDFIIERDSKELPQNMYSVKLRDEKRCEKLTGEYDITNLFDCAALEPGWSSEESLNEYETEVPEKDDDEPEEEVDKGEVDEKEDDNDFKDDEEKAEKSTGSNPPWEKGDDPEFDKGDVVTFEDEGEDFDGIIEEINDGVAAVQTGSKKSDVFDIPLDELTLVEKAKKPKPKKKPSRRRG